MTSIHFKHIYAHQIGWIISPHISGNKFPTNISNHLVVTRFRDPFGSWHLLWWIYGSGSCWCMKKTVPPFFCVKAIKNMFKNQEQVNDLKNPSIFDFLFLNDYIYIYTIYVYEYHTYIITVSFETFRSIFLQTSPNFGDYLHSSIRFRTATAPSRELGWLQLQTSSFVVHLLITKHRPELWFRGMYITVSYIWNNNTTLKIDMCVSPVVPFRKLWANLCSNHPKNTVVLSLPVTWNQDMGQKRIILSKPKSFILDSWQRISLKCFFNDVIYRLGLQIIGSNWLDCSARILSTPTTPQKRNHFIGPKLIVLYFTLESPSRTAREPQPRLDLLVK